MTEWVLNIEESSKLAPKNIFVLQKGERKLYCKTVLTSDGKMLELIPLTVAELKELGVSVEESYSHENIFEMDVEESASEEPKKSKVFNMNDPSDVAEASEIAKRQLERLKKEDPEHFDLEKKEDLESENEDLKAKLAIVAEKELERKMNQLDVPEHLRATFRADPSKLQGYELAKEKPRETPSGSMPLNDAQIKSYVQKQGEFASEAELIADLRKREREGDKSATKILAVLYTKMAKGLRTKQVEFEADENDQPTLKEICKKHKREDD
jgi:hypothetical protein